MQHVNVMFFGVLIRQAQLHTSDTGFVLRVMGYRYNLLADEPIDASEITYIEMYDVCGSIYAKIHTLNDAHIVLHACNIDGYDHTHAGMLSDWYTCDIYETCEKIHKCAQVVRSVKETVCGALRQLADELANGNGANTKRDCELLKNALAEIGMFDVAVDILDDALHGPKSQWPQLAGLLLNYVKGLAP